MNWLDGGRERTLDIIRRTWLIRAGKCTTHMSIRNNGTSLS